MLKISKNEAFAMRKICGSGSVKKTYSKHPTYYLVQTKKNMDALLKFRAERVHYMRYAHDNA